MADISEQVGNQVLKMGGNFIRSGAEFIEELLKILEKNAIDDPNKNTLINHMKNGGKTYSAVVKDEDVGDLKRHLTEQNVAFVFMPIPGDNAKLMVCRDIDKERTEFATKLLAAERGLIFEFDKHEFINMTPAREMACISGLSLMEYELFREKARECFTKDSEGNKQTLKYAATIDDKGNVSILYNINNKDLLDLATKKMAWQLTGRNGDEYQTSYETKIEAQEALKKLYKNDLKEGYIVDAHDPNRILKIEDDKLLFCRHYDPNKTKEENFKDAQVYEFKDKEFVSNLNQLIKKFEQPVLIKEKEFKNRENILKVKLPEIDMEWEERIQPVKKVYEEYISADGKIDGRDIDKDFSFTRHFEERFLYDEKTIFPVETEKKEVDLHVKSAAEKMQSYQHYKAKDHNLDKHLEMIKKQKEAEQAKKKFEKQQEEKAKQNIKRKEKEEKRNSEPEL